MLSGREGSRTQQCLTPDAGFFTALVSSNKGTSGHLLGLEWGLSGLRLGKQLLQILRSSPTHTCWLRGVPGESAPSELGTGKELPSGEGATSWRALSWGPKPGWSWGLGAQVLCPGLLCD